MNLTGWRCSYAVLKHSHRPIVCFPTDYVEFSQADCFSAFFTNVFRFLPEKNASLLRGRLALLTLLHFLVKTRYWSIPYHRNGSVSWPKSWAFPAAGSTNAKRCTRNPFSRCAITRDIFYWPVCGSRAMTRSWRTSHQVWDVSWVASGHNVGCMLADYTRQVVHCRAGRSDVSRAGYLVVALKFAAWTWNWSKNKEIFHLLI